MLFSSHHWRHTQKVPRRWRNQHHRSWGLETMDSSSEMGTEMMCGSAEMEMRSRSPELEMKGVGLE